MSKNALLFSTLFFISISLSAQFKSVQYDFEKNWFGENQLLPAETSWILNGNVPQNIELVEVSVYDSDNIDKKPLHISNWNKPLEGEQTEFYVPINYSLRGNSEYTILIKYFRKSGQGELNELRRLVSEASNAYLELNVVADKNDVDLKKHPKLIKKDLDKLVGDGLSLYRNELKIPFPGFSQLVSDQLANMEDLRLRDGRFNVIKKKDEAKGAEKVRYYQQQLDNLKKIIDREIDSYLSFNFYTLEVARVVSNYKTENTRNELSINAGYGAIYDNVNKVEDISSTEYAGAPFVGVSFPLANANLAGKFWSNSAISAGVFLQDFEFDNDVKFTGPLIDKPFYLAYGYRVLYFLRLNAGATFLENADGSGDVFVRPFVGASIEINLWLGLGKK